jgi:hypothetical protein
MNAFTAIASIVGAALVVTGSAMVYCPLGFLVGGALLLGLAFASARSKKRTS